MPDQPTTAAPNFEAALKRLEEIVHLLEEGNVGLNESLERYEEGVKLLRQSYDLLERAERRIELLSGVDADGNPVTQPFDASATLDKAADADESAKRRSRRRSSSPKKTNPGKTELPNGGDDVDEPWSLS
jgi:exodeoxyribonuclease VII small subunit